MERCCVPSLSHVWLFATPWIAARQAPLSFTISQSLLKLISTESVMLSNHLILCRPLLLLPWLFPSIRVHEKISKCKLHTVLFNFLCHYVCVGEAFTAGVLAVMESFLVLMLTFLLLLFSRSVVSDFLRPHGLQSTSLPNAVAAVLKFYQLIYQQTLCSPLAVIRLCISTILVNWYS